MAGNKEKDTSYPCNKTTTHCSSVFSLIEPDFSYEIALKEGLQGWYKLLCFRKAKSFQIYWDELSYWLKQVLESSKAIKRSFQTYVFSTRCRQTAPPDWRTRCRRREKFDLELEDEEAEEDLDPVCGKRLRNPDQKSRNSDWRNSRLRSFEAEVRVFARHASKFLPCPLKRIPRGSRDPSRWSGSLSRGCPRPCPKSGRANRNWENEEKM